MSPSDSQEGSDKRDRFISEVRRQQELRMKGYREQALKMFPPVCGRCGREFEGKRLRELTVHHKDHDHSNNPPDGSNWELLCIYCHDNEHSRYSVAEWYEETSAEEQQRSMETYKPFAGLEGLLKNKK